MARRLTRKQRYEEALSLLGSAIAQIPRADLYDYRGVLCAFLHKEGEALEDYGRALALASKPVEQAQILYHRGLLYGRRQSFDLALQDMDQAQRLDPANTLYEEAAGQIRIESQAGGSGPAATVPDC